MAKANATTWKRSEDVGTHGGSTMSAPGHFNPLIEDSDMPEDTIDNVQAALRFIGESLTELATGSGLNKITAHGAERLISCCISALDSVKATQFSVNEQSS